MSRFGQCLIYLAICGCLSECANSKYSLDKRDWVDPGDMLGYDTVTKTMKPVPKYARRTPEQLSNAEKSDIVENAPDKVEETPSTSQTGNEVVSCGPSQGCPPCENTNSVASNKHQISCEKCDLKFVKRFVQRFLNHFLYEKSEVADELTFDVKMGLTKDELLILESYTNSESDFSIIEVDDILSRLIRGVRLRQSFDVDFDQQRTPNVSHFFTNNAVPFLIAFAVLVVAIIWTRLTTVKAYIMLSVMILFLASTGYEWMHLYQKLEAEKMAERSQFQEVPAECDPSRISFFGKIYNSLAGNDRCKDYYQSMMVDTLYEINPMLAVTSMIGRMFEMLSKSIGVSIGAIYQNAVNQMSWFGGILMYVVLTVIIIAMIHAYMQYAVLRPRQPQIQQIYVPAPPTIMHHHRDAVHDVNTSQHQQQQYYVRGDDTAPQRLEHHKIDKPQTHSSSVCCHVERQRPSPTVLQPPAPGSDYYCIRRQPSTGGVSSTSCAAATTTTRDEVFYVSGDVPHGQCECRLGDEAGVHLMADSAHQLLPSSSATSSLQSLQTEQAEKIALIVSRLADELEKTLISRRGETDSLAAGGDTATSLLSSSAKQTVSERILQDEKKSETGNL